MAFRAVSAEILSLRDGQIDGTRDQKYSHCNNLAVLTEPQQHEMHEKTNTNAVRRSAETDATREVSLPHHPTESHS